MRLLSLGLVTVAVSAAAFPVNAQTTAWGDPDLQGVWTNQTPTPLERPPGMAEKEFLTEAEAAALERSAVGQLFSGVPDEQQASGELNEVWLDTHNGKVVPSRRTSLIVDPADGRIPYTASGRKRWDSRPGFFGPPPRGPEDRWLSERCLIMNGLMIPNPFYGNLHRILQTPDHVVIITEMMNERRIVALDRDQRGPLVADIPQWFGRSRGWWEGHTLVVETTQFKRERRFKGATEHLQTVERFTRLDDETIRYRLTASDSESFSRPWTLENPLRKADGPLYEYACHEGNYSMVGTLAGARADERR